MGLPRGASERSVMDTCHGAGTEIKVRVPSARVALALLAELGERVEDFEFRHGSMDDVFLNLTGRQIS